MEPAHRAQASLCALLFIGLLSLPLLAQADPRACLVVAVSEGDAFTARCGAAENHEQIKVRIAAIDAPEMDQPFGLRARNALRDLCHGETAKIDPIAMDRHGRTVAYVECREQDAARYMIARGLAWVDPHGDGIEAAPLYKAEAVMQDARVGLWRDPHAVAPWQWRSRKVKRAGKP